jgi:GT2 family glycosyltransferase
MRHDLVPATSVPVRCDTFNGNVVLVPADVVAVLGNLEPTFVHAMGDTDYGLRAGDAGLQSWVMPGFAGTCSNNSKQGTFNDRALTLAKRLRRMSQPKGLPPVPWLVMTHRHAGPLWPAYWAWPYLRVIGDSLLERVGRARRAVEPGPDHDPRLRTL